MLNENFKTKDNFEKLNECNFTVLKWLFISFRSNTVLKFEVFLIRSYRLSPFDASNFVVRGRRWKEKFFLSHSKTFFLQSWRHHHSEKLNKENIYKKLNIKISIKNSSFIKKEFL